MHWRLPPGHTFSGKAASGGDLKVPANMELIILRDEGLKSLLGERPYANLKKWLVQRQDPASMLADEFPDPFRTTVFLVMTLFRCSPLQRCS